MATTLAFAASLSASGTVPAGRMNPTPDFGARFVESLVTIAAMAWFTVALAGLIGELHGVPPAPVAQPTVARDVPAALPQASMRPGISAYERTSLI